MFKQELKDKYPFLTDYFESGLKSSNRALAHSILLYGTDVQAQYDLAQEIARLLNCKSEKNEGCSCINCNWIKEGQHPAVLTISKIDNKPSDDTSKTVISVEQARMVKNMLLNTSDYHRVFIFCDAQVKDGVWTPSGLNWDNFQDITANALLKIIEEPPADTTFFFLTRDKNDLIQTIISRSQSFYVPGYDIEKTDYSSVEKTFQDYLTFERKDSFDLAEKLFEQTKEKPAADVLDEIQKYLLELMKSNVENKALSQKILRDIKFVEHAKEQLNSNIRPQFALEDMCLNITKG